MPEHNKEPPQIVSGWFPNPHIATRALTSQVLADHDRFLKEKILRANSRVRSELKRITKGRDSNQGRSTPGEIESEDIPAMLESMSLKELSAYISSQTEALNTAHIGLEEKRSRGLHKVSSRTQSFILEFDRFVNAYSGIVNIVMLADAQYGGVACATLALLFSTVRMKAKEEETLIAAIQQISDRLPDLRVYQRIYPEPDLGAMLMDAYKDVILLAREATSYFLSSTWGRQVASLGKPLRFETMEQSMRENFSRIRLKCEALLAAKVDSLVLEVQGLHNRLDTSTVAKITSALQPAGYQTEDAIQSLKLYRQVLASTFDNDRHREKLHAADFLALDVGQHWQGGGSCLVMLSGRNENGVSSPLSWLSPLAVDLILMYLSDNKKVLFVVCEAASTLETSLACLAIQLLEQNPAVVRKHEEWYKIQKLMDRCGEERTEALSEALLRMIGLQNEPVYIVIDRPELSEADSAREFAETMLRLVEQTDGIVKGLIVHRAEFWDWEENKSGVVRKGVPAALWRALRVDQHRV